MLVPYEVSVLESKRLLKKGKNISIIGAMTLQDGFLTGLSFDGGTKVNTFL